MSNTNYYPELDTGMLLPVRVVFEGMANDPLWLERPACPYDDETKDRVRTLWAMFRSQVRPAPVATVSDATNKWDALSEEMTKLFDELRGFSMNIPEEDTKERLSYFRTATALLDKITGLAERIHNIKSVSEFQAKVLGVFDEVLAPDQRTRALELLGQ